MEVSLAISRRVARSQDVRRTLDEIFRLVAQLQGTASVDLNVPGVDFQPVPISELAFHPNASSIAEVSYGGERWGSIKISFDAATVDVERPVRFAKLLGQ